MRMIRLVHGLSTSALGVLILTTLAGGQETTRVSVNSAGAQGNKESYDPAISADGSVVAFWSYASNLVIGDTNGWGDVFIHDRLSGTTERVSVDSSGGEGNNSSWGAATSTDGQIVTFQSWASNLVAGDTNRDFDVFVHDRSTGLTERVSVDSSGSEGNACSGEAAISADGKFVTFLSYASNLVTGDTNGSFDVFVHDRSTGITERISVDSSGAQGNSHSYDPSISADGQIVAFQSGASNLVSGDTNGWQDIFVHDRTTGTTERVSVDSSGAEWIYWSGSPSISSDGRVVAFFVSDYLGGYDGFFEVWVHDRLTGISELVSVDSSGSTGNSWSFSPAISSDGQIVAFASLASNLVAGDLNGTADIFVHYRSTGVTERASVNSSGAEGDGSSDRPSISADGQVVAFWSYASNFVSADTNGTPDVFAHERCAVDATWSNYGTGFPGTLGVPSLESREDPLFGTTITLDLGNSSGMFIVGLLLVGFQETSVPTNKGGDLLVVPALTILLLLAPSGTSIEGDIPANEALCGLEIFAQALELDPGAANGVSFTPGLKLVFGH